MSSFPSKPTAGDGRRYIPIPVAAPVPGRAPLRPPAQIRLDPPARHAVLTRIDDAPSFPNRPPRIVLFQDVRPFYFVTFNTHDRRPGLACESVNRALQSYGHHGYAEHRVALGRYVLMPDHVHLFVVLPEPGPTLSLWVRGLKRRLGAALAANGAQMPFWQEGFFDHVLRSGESYSEKWAYVRQNPVRAGLCATPEAWPWQGEIVPLRF